MRKTNATPADLARVVFNKIKVLKTSLPLPSQAVLNKLFENLFYASLKTEESDFIKVTITLINSENPDPKPPKRIVKHRWNVIRFQENIDFDVKNIVKLSKAADPWSSSLAVDFNSKGKLFIWGLIDQSIHYQNYLHYESESGPEQPGIFQTSITAIGTLLVILDYDLIATLKQNILISNYVDVFKYGKVSEIIKSHSRILTDEIDLFLKEYPNEENEVWNDQPNNLWATTLSRILIRIQNYKHGGSFIITNETSNDFDIKHNIQYDRVYSALKNLLKFSIAYNSYSNLIFDIDDEEQIPIELYLDESISDSDKEESSNELNGAIRFVASLSCIDGLVVINQQLGVEGFGAVVKNIKLPELVYISKTARINFTKLDSINPNHFGTRHRAMFSYCWKNEGSLGFVVSQDGDIRAITKIGDKLIMWENIKVQHLYKSPKLKSPIFRNRK
jgi:hypothetical protein